MHRNYGIDLIKILASSFVVIVHYFSRIGFYDIPYNNGFMMILSTGLYVLSFCAVPLFLIATGYLLSNRKISKSHYKKIFYFLFEVAIIITLTNLAALVYTGNFEIMSFFTSTIQILLSPPYYIGVYFSLYLVSPFLNVFFDSLETKELKSWFIVVLVIVISLPTIVNLVPFVKFLDARPTALWSVLYYFIGMYIKRTQIQLKAKYSLFIIIITCLIYGIAMNIVRIDHTYSHVFGYYEGIFPVIISTSFFMLFYRWQIKGILLMKILTFLSSSTLTFYISSSMFSDMVASDIITTSGVFLTDLLLKAIPFTFVSMLVCIPIALFTFFITNSVNKFIKFKGELYEKK